MRSKHVKDPCWTVSQHVDYEARVTKQLILLQDSIDLVLKKIDTVENIQINGSKGLEQFLINIDTDVKSLKMQEAAHWWNRPIKYIFSSKSGISKIVWLAIFYVVLSSILHTWGLDLNFDSISKMFK